MKVVFSFHILRTMLIYKKLVAIYSRSRLVCSEFCRAIYPIAPRCAMTFDDGINHRTKGDRAGTQLGVPRVRAPV